MTDKKLKFRIVKGVGSHYYGKKRYNSGDEISLYPHEADKIKHKLQPIGDHPTPASLAALEAERIPLEIVEREDGKYDVINAATGNPINDLPLELGQAKVLTGGLDDDGTVPLKVLHRGGGRYVVVNTETDEQEFDEYFTKDEANALATGGATIADILTARGAEDGGGDGGGDDD